MRVNAHKRQITDIVELKSPRLVASCSLDGKIRLWDLADKKCKTNLIDPVTNTNKYEGIRGMTYSAGSGNNLLSYGFEMVFF